MTNNTLKQSEKSKKFIKAVETLLNTGEVKNKLAIVKALDWDNTMLSNVLAGRRNIPPDIYKKFTNIYQLEINDSELIKFQSIIRIEAKCDVILSSLAEILAEQKGKLVAQIINDQETMVSGQIKQKLEELK